MPFLSSRRHGSFVGRWLVDIPSPSEGWEERSLVQVETDVVSRSRSSSWKTALNSMFDPVLGDLYILNSLHFMNWKGGKNPTFESKVFAQAQPEAIRTSKTSQKLLLHDISTNTVSKKRYKVVKHFWAYADMHPQTYRHIPEQSLKSIAKYGLGKLPAHVHSHQTINGCRHGSGMKEFRYTDYNIISRYMHGYLLCVSFLGHWIRKSKVEASSIEFHRLFPGNWHLITEFKKCQKYPSGNIECEGENPKCNSPTQSKYHNEGNIPTFLWFSLWATSTIWYGSLMSH